MEELELSDVYLVAYRQGVRGERERITEALQGGDEHDRLREFVEWCLDTWAWDNEPDGGEIQDKAEELGLIELRPIPPDRARDGETGHYFCVWTPKEAEDE